MLNIAYQSMEFLLCFIENLILYIFFAGCCQKRINNSVLQGILLLGMSVTIFIKDMFAFTDFQLNWYAIICISIYVIIQFQMKCWQYVVYIMLYLLICFSCDFIVIQMYCIIYSETTIESMMNFHALRYNAALMSKLCAFVILFYISEKEKKAESISFSKISLMLLVGTTSMSLIILYALDRFIWYSLEWTNNIKIDVMLGIVSLFIVFINMVIYWAIRKVNLGMQKEKEYLLIQYQNELLIKSAEENKAVESEWRRIRHDFNNHISCIDMLLQMGNIDRARGYIQNLTQRSQIKVSSFHVGNEIADAVINQKVIRAKNHDIDISIKGVIPSNLEIEDMDLCALLSNSLDNAIEATSQIEEKEKRKIELAIKSDLRHVHIKVSNSVKEPLKTKEWLPTTKKDKARHGIGMRSMQTAVKKYRGSLCWQCDDRTFVLNIMLPI